MLSKRITILLQQLNEATEHRISLLHKAFTPPMHETYIADKTFDKIDFAQSGFLKGEYENCIFNNCQLSEVNLSGCQFIDCTFNSSNLALAKLNDTVLRDVTFKDCKMLGLRFELCSQFALSFSFDGCQLNHSSFYKTKIKKAIFNNCEV